MRVTSNDSFTRSPQASFLKKAVQEGVMAGQASGFGADQWQFTSTGLAGPQEPAPVGGYATGVPMTWVQGTAANPLGLSQQLAGILYAGVGQDLAGYRQYVGLVGMLNQYSGAQLVSIANLVNSAQSGLEQVFILKALAAKEPWNNLVAYANEIRGQDEGVIYAGSTMRDDQDLMQQWQDSCGPATMQVMAGEADPRYAWELNKYNRLAAVDPRYYAWGIATQQKAWLEKYGGVAVERGQTGGRGIPLDDMVNQLMASVTSTSYQRYAVQGTREALDQLTRILQDGFDVPIRVVRENNSGHFMLMMSVRHNGYERQFQIHDTDTGRTRWVSESNITLQQMPELFGGFSRLSHYYAPTAAA